MHWWAVPQLLAVCPAIKDFSSYKGHLQAL